MKVADFFIGATVSSLKTLAPLIGSFPNFESSDINLLPLPTCGRRCKNEFWTVFYGIDFSIMN